MSDKTEQDKALTGSNIFSDKDVVRIEKMKDQLENMIDNTIEKGELNVGEMRVAKESMTALFDIVKQTSELELKHQQHEEDGAFREKAVSFIVAQKEKRATEKRAALPTVEDPQDLVIGEADILPNTFNPKDFVKQNEEDDNA